MNGIIMGVVDDDEGNPHVAIGALKQAPLVLTVEYAGMVFEQLGMLLDELGYFSEDEEGSVQKMRGTH